MSDKEIVRTLEELEAPKGGFVLFKTKSSPQDSGPHISLEELREKGFETRPNKEGGTIFLGDREVGTYTVPV